MIHRHRRVQRIIDAHFVRGLSRSARRRLFAELENCPTCAARFDRQQELEGALLDEPAPNGLLIERLESALLPLETAKATDRGWFAAVRWPGAAALAVLLVAAAVWLWTVTPVPRDAVSQTLSPDVALTEWMPRGAVHSDSNNVGIRLFRVSPDRRSAAVADTLLINDTITFSYTSVDPHIGYLALLALQEDRVLWFYPLAGQEESMALDAKVVDRPLGHGFRLTPGLEAGKVRIVALFSEKPLTKAGIETVVKEAKAGYNEDLSWLRDRFDGKVLGHTIGVTLE